MNREEIYKLVGGYATGTLTPEERELLFAAALEDQELFDALANEQALRDLLSDPAAKAELLTTLSDPARPWAETPAWMHAEALAAAAAPGQMPAAPAAARPEARRHWNFGWLRPAAVLAMAGLAVVGVVVWWRSSVVTVGSKIPTMAQARPQIPTLIPAPVTAPPARREIAVAPGGSPARRRPAAKAAPASVVEDTDAAKALPAAAPPAALPPPPAVAVQTARAVVSPQTVVSPAVAQPAGAPAQTAGTVQGSPQALQLEQSMIAVTPMLPVPNEPRAGLGGGGGGRGGRGGGGPGALSAVQLYDQARGSAAIMAGGFRPAVMARTAASDLRPVALCYTFLRKTAQGESAAAGNAEWKPGEAQEIQFTPAADGYLTVAPQQQGAAVTSIPVKRLVAVTVPLPDGVRQVSVTYSVAPPPAADAMEAKQPPAPPIQPVMETVVGVTYVGARTDRGQIQFVVNVK